MSSGFVSCLLKRFVGAAPLAVALFYGAEAGAQTGLAACGNIDVRANAECEVVGGVECTAQCEPARFEAACSAECAGSCTASASVDCVASCQGECTAQCTANPGQFDCTAGCSAVCDGDCSAACEASSDGSTCQAQCRGRCEASCEADCSVEPPQADCEARCQGSCEGRCDVQANAVCDVMCTGSCKAELQGGCTGRCNEPEGALFCDGQYVDTGNNLRDCVTALRDTFGIEVRGYADGSASCANNRCVAEGEAGCSCRVAERTSPGSGSGAMLLVGALSAAALSRRGRRR